MASAVERTDEHVREYLLYRGFTAALKHLDGEIKADREKGFRVDKVVEHLLLLVQVGDLVGLKEYWGFLERRLFCRLEEAYRATVSKLRASLYRYYVVHTIQRGLPEKTLDFFQRSASELQSQAEWRDWFVLPFVSAPELSPAFAPYFTRQWSDTFLVSLHNFLSVLFQGIPQPVLLSLDAELQWASELAEENEQLRQALFALQGESSSEDVTKPLVHHKLPAYVQHMDRLGDSQLDLVSSQRAASALTNPNASANANASTPSRNFFSTFLPQTKRTVLKPTGSTGHAPTAAASVTGHAPAVSSSPSQSLLGRKEVLANQGSRSKDQKGASPDPRHKKNQEHEKERQELFFKCQTPEKKKEGEGAEVVEAPPPDGPDPAPTLRVGAVSDEGGGASSEEPFIKLSQEEYGEHHSSIMHCRVDSSGRRVASLDVDGVIKVWSFNPSIQTKATVMSKFPLLSLEWATKPHRLLLLGSGVGTVRLYDTDAKKNLYEMNIDDAHQRILSLSCSPSGSSFVCSAAGSATRGVAAGHLLLWDTKTVKQQLQFSLLPDPVAINCTAFNHNGNLLVTGAADGFVRLFDMQQYESILSWRAHDGEVYSVEFSYDENTVYSVGEDGKFIQWNIHRCGVKQAEQQLSQDATGPFVLSGYSGYKQVQTPRGRLFAFDSEGRHVLTCSSGGGVIHQLTGGESSSGSAGTLLRSVMALGGHKAPVVTVDWSSALDCGSCLTASMDGKIKLSTLLAHKA